MEINNILSNLVIHEALAQSVPADGKPIQRTIVEEGSAPKLPQTAETQANFAVFYGLAGVVLVIVAIGVAMMYWGNVKKP